MHVIEDLFSVVVKISMDVRTLPSYRSMMEGPQATSLSAISALRPYHGKIKTVAFPFSLLFAHAFPIVRGSTLNKLLP